MEHVYLDYAASTPIDPRVADAVVRAMTLVGNPSSTHFFGRKLRANIDGARDAVARLFGASASAVTFTSGATEANAHALLGAWRRLHRENPGKNLRLLTSPIEHASVAGMVAHLASEEGAIIDVLPVGKDGVVRAEDVRAALTPETALITVMWVNNVIGTVQPIAEIGRIVAAERARRGLSGVQLLFHCDGVQAVPTQRVSFAESGVDLLAVSAHKMYGPKGVGALVCSSRAVIDPIVVGGGQERGLRGGTENSAGIAGFGRAAEILLAEREADVAHARSLRAKFLVSLHAHMPHAEVVGDGERCIHGTVFLRIPGATGDLLAMMLDAAGVAVSAGSACDSGKRRQSSTLAAVLGEQQARAGGVRISFGRFTTAEDVQACAAALGKV